MFLMLYDIEGKRDPHGIRIRLVRSLRKIGAFQLQKSAWLFDGFEDDLLRITNEFRRAGGSVKIMEWLPRTIGEVAKRDVGRTRTIAVALLGAEPILEGWHERVRTVLERLGHRVLLKPVGESAMVEYVRKEGGKRDLFLWERKSNSRILDEISLLDIDGMVLLNVGRSTQSGILFGAETIANTRILRSMTSFPLVQLERAGKPDGVLIVWNESGKALGRRVAEELEMALITPSLEVKRVTKERGREIRQIQFARTGDDIVVNGLKVGVCLTDQVYLIAENGRLVDIMGGKILKREAKKLVFKSLSNVVVKTMTLGR
ncbi:MAG: DUF2117 domain-containing protein [Candidatus Methanomethyliaceae archaeon]|nr:DUF2117 domain-containing protein [Candidatus Methanomethyliaceae archaeon]MDD1766417.1 DUF2117 domain-containing protein [Candidatus Methanomethyliaceae archaeon]